MSFAQLRREVSQRSAGRNANVRNQRFNYCWTTLYVALLLSIVAVVTSVAGISQAAVLTWTNGDATDTWNTTDVNWTSGGPTTYTDGGVDDVIFNGTPDGTITIQSGGVTAQSMTVSGGTYHFDGTAVGDTLTTTPIILSGGTLQYTGAGRLGTGQIDVTGDATIQSLGTAAQTRMDNSAIVVSDGVTLDIRNTFGGSTPLTPTIAPIHGGSLGNPITVRLNLGGGTNGYIPSSGSTFIGDFRITHRTYLPTVDSSMFGALTNTIYGSIEARLNGGGGSIDQNINATSGANQWHGGSGLTLNGNVTTTGGELTGGTIRFTNPGNSLGSWSMNQGFVLEFEHDGNIGFSAVSANGPDGAGVGKTIRWVGANRNGLATANWTLQSYGSTLTANIDVQDATSTANWTGNWRGNNANSTTFDKEGAGVLNWTGNSTGSEAININVNGGTLNINSIVNNIATIDVESGATLGGNGTITLDSGASVITVNDGGSIAPGTSVGTLTINGGLTLNDGSTLTMELGSMGDLIVVNGLLTGSVSTGGITLEVLQLPNFGGEYVLMDWTGGSISNFDLSDFQVIGGGSGVLSIVGSQLLFTVPVPEPSSFCLLGLGLLALARKPRRRRTNLLRSV